MFKFVESASFSRRVRRYLAESDQRLLHFKLLENPRFGVVIPGSGGVRKLRWRAAGRGKRGGLRVVYAVDWSKKQILLLTIYAKNEKDSIPLKALREIRKRM